MGNGSQHFQSTLDFWKILENSLTCFENLVFKYFFLYFFSLWTLICLSKKYNQVAKGDMLYLRQRYLSLTVLLWRQKRLGEEQRLPILWTVIKWASTKHYLAMHLHLLGQHCPVILFLNPLAMSFCWLFIIHLVCIYTLLLLSLIFPYLLQNARWC